MNTGIGGKIRGVSLDSFLQIVQMDRMTCTLKVMSREGFGFLYFVRGEIFSAITGDMKNAEAACRIISWEDAVIEIDEKCDKKENEIQQPLMNILMEGMRLRDDAKEKTGTELQSETSQLLEDKETPSSPITEKPKSPSIKIPPRKKRKTTLLVISISCLLGIIGALAYFVTARQLKSEYDAIIAKVQRTIPLEKKKQILNTYISKHSEGGFVPDAQSRVKALHEKIVTSEFSQIERNAAKLIKKEDLKTALALFEQFEEKYPASNYIDQLTRKKRELSSLIDERAFVKLEELADDKRPERLFYYLDFIKQNPKSRHRQNIETRIDKMSNEFYGFTENQILKYEKTNNWKTCLDLSQQYIDIYPYSEHSSVLKKYQSLCKTEIEAIEKFTALKQQAAALKEEYQQIIKLFDDFLKANPQTRAKKNIEKEIARVEVLAEKKRVAFEIKKMTDLLKPLGKRFVVHDNGTVSDTRTGLMWCLIDATTQLNKCLNFPEAKAFVLTLETGGHTDWRLPRKEELTELYKQKPYFPAAGPTWYWTSQTHKRYLGRWMINVDVVTTETSKKEDIANKESWHCGAVRAVRGKRKK